MMYMYMHLVMQRLHRHLFHTWATLTNKRFICKGGPCMKQVPVRDCTKLEEEGTDYWLHVEHECIKKFTSIIDVSKSSATNYIYNG